MTKTSRAIRALYDDHYYKDVCGGPQESSLARVNILPRRLADAFNAAALMGTETVLDVGCGRGEMVSAAAARGCRAVGFDYSPAAVAMAQELVKGKPWSARCQFIGMDVVDVNLTPDSFDVAFLLDVVEHLSLEELESTIKHVAAALKPGGRVIVHTSPNRSFYTIAYRLARALSLLFGNSPLPENGRGEHEKAMHINEMTRSELSRAMAKAGFVAQIKRTGLERIQELCSKADFRNWFQALLSYTACCPVASKYTASDLFGMAAKNMAFLDDLFHLEVSKTITLENPFFFHEGWYEPVLDRQPAHRWASPFFSLKAWARKPMRIHMRFSRLRLALMSSFFRRGFSISMTRQGPDRLLTIFWPATLRPVTLGLCAFPIWGVGNDPRCLGGCLEQVWSENA